MSLSGKGGKDPTKAVIEEVQDLGKKATREAMTVWHTEAIQRIQEAAGQRSTDPPGGDSENKEYRRNNKVHELAQEFSGIEWNPNRGQMGAWEFANTHFAAKWHEWGADAHEIEARRAQALAFPWADGPDELTNEEGWAFFDKVDHPGTPAIGFMRYGRQQADKYLEGQGISARGFGVM